MLKSTDKLSHSEFENFSNLLVSQIFNKKIETFAEGRDGGIDGMDDSKNPTIIVQSKKFREDTSATKTRDKIISEIVKVRKLIATKNWNNVIDYVVVTSSNLTPEGKRIIRETAGPLMSSDECIITANDINDYSKDDLYRKIFVDFELIKLSGIELKGLTIKNEIEADSKYMLSSYKDEYFVKTKAFNESMDILTNERLVFLHGDPGVGKTINSFFLSKNLKLYLENEYGKKVYIKKISINDLKDISTTFNTYFDDEYLILILDDILGASSLEATESNFSNAIDFFYRYKIKENLFLIINTRTQILNKALKSNSKFDDFVKNISNDNQKVLIDITKLSDVEKAQILRKSFEKVFNNLTENKADLQNLYSEIRLESNYQKILSHKNFNPRLISAIADNWKNSNDNIVEYIEENLNNTDKLYNEMYRSLSDFEQEFLIYLYSYKFPIKKEVLENGTKKFVTKTLFDFSEMFAKLDGSWVNQILVNDNIYVDFANPTIKEFINKKVSRSQNVKEFIVENANTLTQLDENIRIEKIGSEFNDFIDKSIYFIDRIKYLINSNGSNVISYRDELISIMNKVNSDPIKYDLFMNFSNKDFWIKLIDLIYFSDNIELEKLFLEYVLFKNHGDTMFNIADEFDLEEIDDYSERINDMFSNIGEGGFKQNEIIDWSEESISNNMYQIFLNRKKELIQEKLDDYLSVENEIYSLYDSFDRDEYIDILSNLFLDVLNEELNRSYFEKDLDIDDFDESIWNDNVYEVVDDFIYDENYENHLKENKYKNLTSDIKSILDKPL